jgi:hypothetical protein
MTILETLYASGGPDVRIITLELTSDAWAEPILICNGFEDQTCVTEDARILTFIAAGIDVALPKKNNTGGQTLTFAIDNITGEAQRLIDDALEAEERVIMTYRTYVSSDKSAPAEAPFRFVVRAGQMQGTAVQVQAGFFDAINTRFPRKLYDMNFAPALRYL